MLSKLVNIFLLKSLCQLTQNYDLKVKLLMNSLTNDAEKCPTLITSTNLKMQEIFKA